MYAVHCCDCAGDRPRARQGAAPDLNEHKRALAVRSKRVLPLRPLSQRGTRCFEPQRPSTSRLGVYRIFGWFTSNYSLTVIQL